MPIKAKKPKVIKNINMKLTALSRLTNTDQAIHRLVNLQIDQITVGQFVILDTA